jgi:alpha-galactosidase
VVKNTGSETLSLTKLMSFCLDLPGSYHITTFDGSWIQEMGKHTLPVLDSRIVNESTTGFSSNRHNPGILLSDPEATEDSGRVYGFNLVYSGNHYSSAQRSHQQLTRVMMGISPDNFCWKLAPGADFEAPEAVLAVSDAGFDGLSQNMHRFVNDHIIPKKWQNRARPILYNDWEGCGFRFDHNRLLGLARKAKKLGCELFVLDDGWFGKRNDDHAGLGDYTVNKKKLPFGLKGLASAVNKLGMEFGLWFEPESVNPDSDLYRAHPDWVLRDEHPLILGRHQLLLDLTKPEVRDYIVEKVSRVLDSANISYVKWDMNRHSVALGEKSHRYILGLYDVLGRIFGPRPNILLESCASGGNRFDLGMLCFSPQIWCSDNTDPIDRLAIQTGLSYLYPQSTFGAHVSAAPHAQTLRHTPLATRGNVSFFGCLGYELDLKHLLPVEIKEIQAQITFYKQYRKIFQFGRFRRLAEGWQVSRGDTTLAGLYSGLCHAAPGYQWLKVKGLNPKVDYRMVSRQQRLRIGQFGGLITHIAPISINPHGILMRTVDHHVTLPDGQEDIHCSGAALASGVALAPRFLGTGYDKNARTQGDFGSNVYVIEPAP